MMLPRTPWLLVTVTAWTPGAALAEPIDDTDGATVTIDGYVEAYYQLQFQNAENRITNLRGFDDRSRTFTLSNAALDVRGETGPVSARIVLEVGSTGATTYLVEPTLPGTPSVNANTGALWQYLQAANLTVNGPRELVFEAGLFTSPVGLEAVAIKDNMNWSRSNLFFGLPFYHTGVMVSHPLAEGWTGKLHVYNGWNSVVDNNGYPSVAVSAAYTSATTTAQLIYFGGIERPTGAPEGKPWRNLFDATVQHALTDTVTVAAQGDAGFEPGDLGTDWWVAGALYGKLAVSDELYLAVRGDVFYEKTNGASAIFWPVPWVAEVTATLAYQPYTGLSVRLEYRHDHADGDAYFGGDVAVDAVTGAYIPDRAMQDTATLGATAWF